MKDLIIIPIMIIGMILLGNKNKWAFPVMMVYNIIVIYNGMTHGLYGLAITNLIYIGMGVRNFIKWR